MACDSHLGGNTARTLYSPPLSIESPGRPHWPDNGEAYEWISFGRCFLRNRVSIWKDTPQLLNKEGKEECISPIFGNDDYN